MADNLTAGGVPVYRDTGGVLREIPQFIADGPGGGSSTVAPTYTNPLGYQQISSVQLGTSQSLNVPAGAMRAVVQNNGAQAVRWRGDGSDPTDTVGQRIIGGDSIDVTGSLSALRFIREAEGVQLDVAYYG
jgi:hypothetical protein